MALDLNPLGATLGVEVVDFDTMAEHSEETWRHYARRWPNTVLCCFDVRCCRRWSWSSLPAALDR